MATKMVLTWRVDSGRFYVTLLSGGAVLHHLLEWVQNGHANKYVKDVLQHPQPHDSRSYWPAVSITSVTTLVISDWFSVHPF